MREDQQIPTVRAAGPPTVLGVGPNREHPLPSVGPESGDTHVVPPAERTRDILTGTFILKSSLLNLNARSERVLWKNPVGRRTRTSWRFAGKDACKRTEGPWADVQLSAGSSRACC